MSERTWRFESSRPHFSPWPEPYNPAVAGVPPTNPHHLASAYGASVAGRISPLDPSALPTPPRSRISVRAPDAPDDPAPASRERIARLVAAVVPGGIDFDANAPAPSRSGGALPFYANPAQRQAAATQIHAHMGRNLDVKG